MANYSPQHFEPRAKTVNVKGVANRAVCNRFDGGPHRSAAHVAAGGNHTPSTGNGDSVQGCSYSFVNWEMLSVRPNRGMLTRQAIRPWASVCSVRFG